MVFKSVFKTAFIGLKTHKLRSLLTLLGIVIGITAIMVVMSLGKGAQRLIVGQIQGLGSKTIIVLPGRQAKGMTDVTAVAEMLLSDSLKERELEALQKKSNVPHLVYINPVVFGSDSASRQRETYQTLIFGTAEVMPLIYTDIYPTKGDFLTAEDVKNYAHVAVIGQKVKEELFGNEEPLGQTIKIKDRNFRVIGILPPKGPASLIDFDNLTIIPYTTAQRYIFGIKHFNRLIIEADSEKNVTVTVRDIETTLRDLHHITDPKKDDFNIQTQENIMERVRTVTDIMTWFLVAVAAISLMVGGVGIMNIMMVSATQRTREIGLRKAVGATNKNILNQFLLEAIILTTSGGIVGILLGIGVSFLISQILSKILALDWKFTFPFLATLTGFVVAALTGLVFGIYPARQASLKSPLEAIRYE